MLTSASNEQELKVSHVSLPGRIERFLLIQLKLKQQSPGAKGLAPS